MSTSVRNPATTSRPVVLCILDGWGYRTAAPDNALSLGQTPVWDQLVATCPFTTLDASAEQVGLPAGQMGNSEVGHMNLGAGRVVLQDLPRIDQAVASGALAQNPALVEFTDALRRSGGVCHLMGLLGPGGVHAQQTHLIALTKAVAAAGVGVRIHAFLDGRDTPPQSAAQFLDAFLAEIAELADVSVATLSGRYYAMDRDRRWDRVIRAYDTLTRAEGEHAETAPRAIAQSYDAGTSDEFVLPTVIGDYRGMADGDGLLMANFRSDRARQLLGALLDPAFGGFPRRHRPAFAATLGMVAYSAALTPLIPALFPPRRLDGIFGAAVAAAGYRQLRIAETEKYAHVTFFFNGGEETVFPGEERILVPSPQVATYNQKPEMSALEVTDHLVAAITEQRFDTIIVNYANGDMVGHTGMLSAAIRAAETVDACLGRLEQAISTVGGVLLITADHGNLEQMRDAASGQPHTAHTTNPVPLVLVNGPDWVSGLRPGRLADVAPTLMQLLGLTPPAEMTGRSLLLEVSQRVSA